MSDDHLDIDELLAEIGEDPLPLKRQLRTVDVELWSVGDDVVDGEYEILEQLPIGSDEFN